MRHSDHAREIDKGKNADPHNIEEVPEQAQAREPPDLPLRQFRAANDLHGQHSHPHESQRDVQPVRADQRKERRQERTAVGAEALADQMSKLMQFQHQKYKTKQKCHGEPPEHRAASALVRAEHRKAVGDAAQKQHRRFQRNAGDIEQILAARCTRELMCHYPEYGKERREEDTVGHQIQPETEYRMRWGMFLTQLVRLYDESSLQHQLASTVASARLRFSSIALTVEAGM